MKKETLIVHAGRKPEKQSGSVNPAIYQTSTILFPTQEAYDNAARGEEYYDPIFEGKTTDPSYGLAATPTIFALQEALCKLDGADYAFITPSGLSAISLAITSLVNHGDHILVSDSVYGPTRRFCIKDLSRFGIETTFYDPQIGSGIKDLIKPNTKVIFVESPGSLTFEIQDIPAIAKEAKKHNIAVVMDNSWASPLYFDSFSHGVDICIHAITKYIGGHSDIVLGAVTCRKDYAEPLTKHFKFSGLHVSPQDCYLALRGLRTMAVRLKQHQENALSITTWLKKRPEVSRILYPALPEHPGHDLWKRDFTGATGLFGIILKKHYPKEAIYKFIDSLKLFGIGCSWGGFESLILSLNPGISRSVTKWEPEGSYIRVYAGLENVDDLIGDLEQGFKHLKP